MISQVAKLRPLAVKKVLDKIVTSKWQFRWNESRKDRAIYEYVKCEAAIGSSIVDFGLEMGFLLKGYGSSNSLLFLMSCVCPVLCDIRNLDNMDVYVVNGIFYFTQCFPVICFNAQISVFFSGDGRNSSMLHHMQYDGRIAIVAVEHSYQFLVFCVSVVL